MWKTIVSREHVSRKHVSRKYSSSSNTSTINKCWNRMLMRALARQCETHESPQSKRLDFGGNGHAEERVLQLARPAAWCVQRWRFEGHSKCSWTLRASDSHPLSQTRLPTAAKSNSQEMCEHEMSAEPTGLAESTSKQIPVRREKYKSNNPGGLAMSNAWSVNFECIDRTSS